MRGALGRDPALDLLRGVALIRVVTYHTTGRAWLTWFTAVPLMFFVGGALFSASLNRRPWREVLPARLRRIVVPMWAWSVMIFVFISVAGLWHEVPAWGVIGFIVPFGPAHGPGSSAGDYYWTWMGLWYLWSYASFMVVFVPLRTVVARRPAQVIGGLVAAAVVLQLVGLDSVGSVAANFAFWVLGATYQAYHWNGDGSRVRLSILACVCAIGGLGYLFVTSASHRPITTIPTLFLGTASLLLAAAFRNELASLARQRQISIVLSWLSQRALSVYLWHELAVGIVAHFRRSWPALNHDVPAVLIVFALTAVIVTIVGPIEDLAAGRHPSLFRFATARLPS